ncbi:hypothetical protein C1645_715010 [Glomus cerebriforme]|uniref:Uncharacterized protein n=1 Tax=Glomus cerebriforme TaxID=658196 RepID=A0A397SKN9_9GLOM|nr:hypothetical protein C1645_715010 [Glomus cerebriforme]
MAKLSVTGIVTIVSIFLYAIILTVLEILVVIFHTDFVQQYRLTRQGDGISQADLIYHSIFILSLAFQVLLCVDALWRKNSTQLIALVLFNILSLAYAGVQLYQHIILERDGTTGADFTPNDIYRFPTNDYTKRYFISRMRPLEYVIISIVAAFSIYLATLSYKLFKEFGWAIYETYSADVKIRDVYRSLSILQTLIKLDIFFIGSYAIQLIPSQTIGYNIYMTEITLTFTVGISMLLMAWYSVMKENKYILLCVINLLTLSVIYLIYRLFKININISPQYDPYEFTRRLLTFSLATTIGLIISTIFYSLKCFKNMTDGHYIFAAYGLPGQEQKSPPMQDKISFNPEYLGYDGYTAGSNNNSNISINIDDKKINIDDNDVLYDSKRASKRASKIAEVQNARLSRRISLD